MPPPPEGRCHFPVKKGGRTVWCGEETMLVDPNTGNYLMFCAKHVRELEEHQRKIRNGHKDYPKGHLLAKNITMHG